MPKKVLITAALPYANGPLHFGHIAGAYLPADVYARYRRQKGDDVLFLSGSDEYGVAITLSAEIEGRSPKEHVDHYHTVLSSFFKTLGISFDHYSRTTWEGHKEPVQAFFQDLMGRGFIEERVTEQLYSETDGRFLADRYVVGTCPRCHATDARGDECQHCGASYEATDLLEPRSKITNAPLTLRETNHWFLRFDAFKRKLQDWLATKAWKPNVLNFVEHYVENLRPRAITRDSKWGIPLPIENTEGKVFYVWFDAPIGYISAAKEWAEKQGAPDRWKEYWLDEKTHYTQFIGKDNIPFHAIFFPAMCMGQKTPYKLVDDLPANEFLRLEGKQFSKSSGWYIDLDRFFQNFTPDQIRYYLAANAPETSDADFSWKEFQLRCNTDLVGKYGNLVNRTLVFLHKHLGGAFPEKGPLTPIDEEFLQKIDACKKETFAAYESYSLRRATQHIMELCSLGNTYFDAKKPWKEKETQKTTIALCIECLNTLAEISAPILPHATEALRQMLAGSPPAILFAKVEDALIEEEIAALKKNTPEPPKKTEYEPLKPPISFDDFTNTDLRVAEILSADPIEKSNKLLKLRVDLGFETRQIVAGIAKAFPVLQNLIGKRVVIVANLKPAKIMGIESQGMLLCGAFQETLQPLFIDDIPPGNPVS